MKSIFKKCLGAILTIIVCYTIYTATSIYLYGNVDETRTCDAAIILGAGIWGDKPSPVFEERIRHGIWLYDNKYVDKLIFTGGKAGRFYTATHARNYVLSTTKN